MNYLTRHLEALVDIDRGTCLVRSGERFTASTVDAEWYLKTRKAKDVAPAAPVQAPAPSPTPAPAEPELTPTGVVLTEGDAKADLDGTARPDNHDRSSWAENETPAPRRASTPAAARGGRRTGAR